MWRWTSFIHLLVLYEYSFPQPITNESENARHSRQLVADECCPCPGSSQGDLDQQSAASFRRGMFDTAQGVDDCPCRRRATDTEGASSILFPNAMRAAGTLLKPADKKENLKPLLHPEVDLASSVLETLREATNEDYREALARDAVRDAVKIVGLSDSKFRDATPEESRGIVTIIMNPKENFEGDIIPQASHLQESRCIHAPLGNARGSLGELNVGPKPLVNEVFRIAKPMHPGFIHRNFMDMDSDVGASSMQEHVVNIDEELMNNRDAVLRTQVPLFKLNPRSESLISDINDCNNRNSDLKFPLISNILKNPLGSSPLQQNIKIGQLTIAPKTRLENLLFGNKNNRMGDNNLSVLPNDVKAKDLERGNANIKELPSFPKPTLKNILVNKRPLNLKQLLKLKDVELIPPDSFNKPKAVLYPTLNRNNNAVITHFNSKMIPPNENCSMETEEPEENEIKHIHMLNNNPFDTEQLEILDTAANPSNTVFCVDNGQTSGDNYETPSTDSNNSIFPITTHEVESKTDIHIDEPNEKDEEISSKAALSACENINENDHEIEEKETSLEFDEQERGSKSDEKYDSRTTSDNKYNLTSGCTNNVEYNLEPKERPEITEENYMVPQGSTVHANITNTEDDIVETTTNKYKLLKPLPLDKTLLSIKEKIQTTLDNLKNINTDIKGISEQNNSHARISLNDDDEQYRSNIKVKPDSDCVNEKSEQLITRSNTTISDDDIENKINSVTIQELQKKSNAMLQEEFISQTEYGGKEEATENRSIKNISENCENESGNRDSETSANTQNADIILPKIQEDHINSNSDLDNANYCQTDLPMSMPTQKIDPTTHEDKTDVTEMNTDASDIVINKLSQEIIPLRNKLKNLVVVDNIQQIPLLSNDPLSVFKTPLPDVHSILEQAPLSSLDDMKLKISNLFKTNERKAQEDPSQEEFCRSTSSNEVKSSMATDASITNFQIKQPSLRSIITENLNQDIFQKPKSNSKTPTFGLDSFKRNLPSITNSKGALGSSLPLFTNDVHATPKVSDIFNDIVQTLPNFHNLRDKMRSNTQELLNIPSLLENNNDNLDLTDLKYHAENTVQNMKQKLEAVGNGFNLRSPTKNTHHILGTLAEKHEDLSDKLRAVHIDFNDRLETLRNSLIEPTYLSNDRIKSNAQPFGNSKSKDRQLLMKSRTPPRVSNRKESLPKPEMQRKVKLSQAIDERKFKMPGAASMPVPRTVEVPLLKVMPFKSTTPTVKDTPIFTSSIRNTEPTPVRLSTDLAKQANKNLKNDNTQLGIKQVIPFQNSKVTVSFSTTPQPLPSLILKPRIKSTAAPISRLKSTARETAVTDTSRNQGINRTPQNIKDSNGALSETNPLTIVTPGENIDDRLRSKLGENDISEDTRNPSLLLSWPKIADSSFLSKVKEAISARLPIVKKFEDQVEKGNKIEDHPTANDALRSASDNSEIIRKEPLQENVSYKCRMVCTRE